jgi:hypothetical protein
MTDSLVCTGKTCRGDGTNPYYAHPGTMLCGHCTQRLERQLAEMPARLQLAHSLHDGRQTPRKTDRRGADTPTPVNVALIDIVSKGLAQVASWVAMVCEERSLRGPDDPTRHAAWLLGQLDWLVRQPWVDDLADEVNDFTRAVEAHTRLNKHRHRLEPPCPTCSARELGRWDGTAQVDCDACGKAWPESQYPWMVRLALDDSQGCVTAQEAARRLEVTVGTVRNYVTEGLIHKLGTVDGTARYSAQDVERLAKQQEGVA